MSIKIEGFPPSTAGITGGLVYQGSLDPGSLPADITSAKKGAFYIVSADGTLAGVAVKINDHIVFNEDAANPLTSDMFDVIDNTESTASETVAGIIEIATNAEAGAATATNKALVPSNLSSINTSDLNNDSGFITSVAAASETVAGKIEIATNAEATAGSATDKALVPSNLSSIGTSQLNNNAGFITSVAAASETVAGKIEIATNAEATAGTATDKALVPSNISSIDLNPLDEISYTAGAGIDGKFLKYVNANSRWEAANAPTAGAASETVAGLIEIATNAEATAGSATDKALVPSNLSSIGTSQLNNDASFITSVAAASETVAGKIEIATNAEAGAATATDKALVPSNLSSINTSDLNNDSGFITSVAAASETVAGKIEIATNAEATAGSATDKALVPSNLSSIGTNQLNNNAGFITSVAAASETVAGKIEIATNAEATAGTATDKALVPSNISSIDLSQLDEISYTAGAAINNYVLTYVHANTQWEAKEATGGGGAALPPEVKETTTSTPVSVSLTPSDSNTYNSIEVIYLVNNSSTAVELDLPTASSNEGKKIHIKRNGTATVTIDPNGTEEIDNGGAGTAITLDVQYEAVSLISNGTNWFII